MEFIRFFMFYIAFMVPAATSAEMPAGADEPAFQNAVETWLADDDAVSLPELARLAQDKNVAAQILLGVIDREGDSLSPWVKTLSPGEKRTIFNDPERKFGGSWLRVAAERSDLAQTLRAAFDSSQMEAAAAKLYVSGEFRTLGHILSLLYNAGKWDTLVALASQRMLPPEYLGVAWHAATSAQSDEALRLMQDIAATIRETDPGLSTRLEVATDLLAGLGPGTPESIDQMQQLNAQILPYFGRYSRERLREAHDGKQIAAVCRTLCPALPESCEAAARPDLGWFPARPILGSPVATLIPTERYVRSQRAIGELLRELARFSKFYATQDEFIEILASNSRCLADHVNATKSR